MLEDIAIGNYFLSRTPIVQVIREGLTNGIASN
jgi:hypothetical protein